MIQGFIKAVPHGPMVQYIDQEGSKQLLPHPIDYCLKKIHYDCNSAEVSDIFHVALIVGPEHLLTSSDFPWTDDTFT